MIDLCIVGCGRIGLPQAAAFARPPKSISDKGLRVHGYDISQTAIDNALHAEFPERGLRSLLDQGLETGNLSFSTTPQCANAYIICVPTPLTKGGKADLSALNAALGVVATAADPETITLVIIESTVPPGTTAKAAAFFDGKIAVNLAYCPERIMPGHAIAELRHNARIVGGMTPGTSKRAVTLYQTICAGLIVETDALTAELAKLFENSYRLVNIALANELQGICNLYGADAPEVIRAANHHPRVDILKPGPGVGGHCVPVDPRFLPLSPLIGTALVLSAERPASIAASIEASLGTGGKIAIFGVAYKGGTDDTRNSPGVEIAGLLSENFTVAITDPFVAKAHEGLTCDFWEAVGGARLLLFLADHAAFAELNPATFADEVKERNVMDCVGILDRKLWEGAGFTFLDNRMRENK